MEAGFLRKNRRVRARPSGPLLLALVAGAALVAMVALAARTLLPWAAGLWIAGRWRGLAAYRARIGAVDFSLPDGSARLREVRPAGARGAAPGP